MLELTPTTTAARRTTACIECGREDNRHDPECWAPEAPAADDEAALRLIRSGASTLIHLSMFGQASCGAPGARTFGGTMLDVTCPDCR